MSKLGLLKDSDFKLMHNRVLPTAIEQEDKLIEFSSVIEKDIRFLEGLKIMDYSLFLIVIQLPQNTHTQIETRIQGFDERNRAY